MATRNKATKAETPQTERSNSDSLRWAFGLALLFIGIYAAVSVLFYLSYWRHDISVLSQNDTIKIEDPRFEDAVENPCGYLGAWLAQRVVGDSFGLFGIILPIVVIMLGIRIIRKRFVFNHAVLSSLLVMLLGSVTLGLIFGREWGLFTTGLGGEYGILLAHEIEGVIGVVGAIILLLGGWILLGVFINRNFINTVNSAGNAMVGKGEMIVDSLRKRDEKGGEQSKSDAHSTTPSAQELAAQPTATTANVTDSGDKTPASEPQPQLVDESTTSQQRSSMGAIRPAYPQSEQTDGGESPFKEVEIQTPAPVLLQTESVADMKSDRGTNEERLVSIEQFEEELKLMERSGKSSEVERTGGDVVNDNNPFVEIPIEDKIEPKPEPQRIEVYKVEDDNLEPLVEVAMPGSDAEIESGDEGVVVTVQENEVKTLKESEIDNTLYDPLKDLVYYKKPTPGLLENYSSTSKVTDEEIFEKKSRIEETLKNFGIPIKSIHATSGPTVTLYEIRQAEGVKISKIQGLENDIAQSIEARGIRIIAPIPGKGTIGIEVPNENMQIVSMYSSICSPEFQNAKMELPVVIGRTIQNKSFTFDLAKAPHLLVAGATGQGKSVGLNAIITSLLYTKHPAELKFVMIDPKQVEFSTYAGLERHFLAKMESEEEAIITDPKKAVYTLHALEQEMEERLGLCKKAGARNIVEYNAKFVARRLPPPKGHRFLPYIVVVIDEFADLIMTVKEVERPVMRLAQKARAVGIHLIVATQRPDVKVITGGIKANFPARIAFRVMQMVDSRTIIDQPGAQTLIGRGDMLFTNGGELTRVQCALVETNEVERIVEYISNQQGYSEAYPLPDFAPESGDSALGSSMGGDTESGRPLKVDSLFAEIARTAVEQGAISVSMIQRNYEVGFNRAGRIMQQLQSAGIVGPQMGAKPRDILYHDLPSLEAKLQDMGVF